jgi:hypothetical protein
MAGRQVKIISVKPFSPCTSALYENPFLPGTISLCYYLANAFFARERLTPVKALHPFMIASLLV